MRARMASAQSIPSGGIGHGPGEGGLMGVKVNGGGFVRVGVR